MNSDIARSWVLANFISLVVTATLGLAGYGLRKTLGIGAVDVAYSAQAIYLAAEVVISAFNLALFARLTGAVLVAVIPALPHRHWMALHMTLGILGGLVFGLMALQPEGESEPFDWNDMTLLIFMFCMFMGGGALIGAAWGGLQALVLRPAARGLRLWVVSSVVALCVVATLMLVAFLIVIPSEPGFVAELITAGTIMAAGVAGALVMIPAVQRLLPR